MNVIGIIPARMVSTRFPGKPLAKIYGLPMIGHVYFRSKMSKILNEVYVATCDRKIAEYVKSIGGNVIMTKTSHRGASDRTAEAMEKIERKLNKKFNVVIMIQGDEPMLYPEMIDSMVKLFIKNKSINIVNLTNQLITKSEYYDTDIVKLLVDRNDFALWFFRRLSPLWKEAVTTLPIRIQTGIIAFRRDFLIQYNSLKPTPLERMLKVDMFRVLENGFKLKTALSKKRLYSVDTIKDLKLVEKKMKNDELMKLYL